MICFPQNATDFFKPYLYIYIYIYTTKKEKEKKNTFPLTTLKSIESGNTMLLGNEDRKGREEKWKRSRFSPKMSLNKCAELKSLHFLNLISLSFPSLRSQHPLSVLFNFLFLKSPLGFWSVSFFIYFLNFYPKVTESSASRIRCVKCKYPPICGEKPRFEGWASSMGCRNKSQVTGGDG